MDSKTIKLGIETLFSERQGWIHGKSIGLITNHTGVDTTLRRIHQLLAESQACRLSAVFSPEHGLWGAVQDGIAVGSSETRSQSVPVYSLYGENTRPTAAQLHGIDLLIYDMQDVGARYYTYPSTLCHAMAAAGEHRVAFIVADRPNPITCEAVAGPLLDPAFESFVGIHPVPIRYGLTIGEFATLLQAERLPACRLKVAWMHNYGRGMWYEETGLQWVPPSPNMPTLETAICYPGTCLFEGTNMSEGRGTTKPFEYIGATWCNGETWAAALNALNLPGVRFRPIVFTPAPAAERTKYAQQVCQGIALHITDRGHFRPIETALWMLATIIAESGDHFAFLPIHFDRLAGNGWLREALLTKEPPDKICARWQDELQGWSARTAQYHHYV